MTVLLLQLINAGLMALSVWTRFRDPLLWNDQAAVLATFAGTFLASLTAILLGLSLVFSAEIRWRTFLPNLLLALGFAAAQGYLLFLLSRETGLIHLLKARLG